MICKNNWIYLVWIVYALYGLFFGFLSMCQEMIIIETIPKNQTGFASGIRAFMHFSLKAVAILIVGLLWDFSVDFFYYYQAFAIAIAALLMFVLIMLVIPLQKILEMVLTE